MKLNEVIALLEGADTKLDNLATDLAGAGSTLTKGHGEIVTELQKLRDEIANGEAPEALANRVTSIIGKVDGLSASTAQIKTTAQTIEDIIPG